MIVNGTTYSDNTPAGVVEILERYRQNRSLGRLRLFYGEVTTGRAWGDVEEGYIGRSTGVSKIPLCVHNARSLGGTGLLESHIVRIETARGKSVLYTHPTFHATEED